MTDFGLEDIEVLHFVEAIRRRPAMYVGGTDFAGQFQYFVYGLSLLVRTDASLIEINIDASTFQTSADAALECFEDNGRVIPFEGTDIRKRGYPYNACALNALSASLEVTIEADFSRQILTWKQGSRVEIRHEAISTSASRTTLKFTPDRYFMREFPISPVLYSSHVRRLSYLYPEKHFSVTAGDRIVELHQPGGIRDLFDHFSSSYQLLHEAVHLRVDEEDIQLEVVLSHHSWKSNALCSFLNGGRVAKVGAHDRGLLEGVRKAKTIRGVTCENGIVAVMRVDFEPARWECTTLRGVETQTLRMRIRELAAQGLLAELESKPELELQMRNIETLVFPESADWPDTER